MRVGYRGWRQGGEVTETAQLVSLWPERYKIKGVLRHYTVRLVTAGTFYLSDALRGNVDEMKTFRKRWIRIETW